MSLDLDINDFLDKGLCAEVYYGKLGSQPIAAKKCYQPSWTLSMHDEANLLKRCDHPNVLKCHGVFSFEGEYYLAMDLAEAGSLEHNLGENAFSIRAKKGLIRQLCLGLEHVHAQNIVHRDIKPANLLLKNITGPHIVIGDFGAAQLFIEGSHRPNSHWIVHDDVYTFKSDIYLLALVAIQIFEDTSCFNGTSSFRTLSSLVSNEEIFSEAKWRRAILSSFDRNPGARPTPNEIHEAFGP